MDPRCNTKTIELVAVSTRLRFFSILINNRIQRSIRISDLRIFIHFVFNTKNIQPQKMQMIKPTTAANKQQQINQK